MKHVFIINPAAGKTESSESLEAKIRAWATEQELDFDVRYTERPLHATVLARSAAEAFDRVRLYACGGDGTLNEVVNGAAGHPNAAVTQIPTGTGNDFVKIFGADCEKLRDVRNFADCETRAIDLIACCGRYSVNVCSVGFDARIGTEVHKYTSLPLVGGKLAYDLSAAANIIKGIHQPMRITAGEQVFDGAHSLVCVCNGRFYGGGFNPVPEAEPDDGLLDCLVVKGVSRLRVAQLIGKYSKGKYREMADIITHVRVKELTVELGTPSPVNIDGELDTAETVTFRAVPGAVNFFFPRGMEYRRAPREESVPAAPAAG